MNKCMEPEIVNNTIYLATILAIIWNIVSPEIVSAEEKVLCQREQKKIFKDEGFPVRWKLRFSNDLKEIYVSPTAEIGVWWKIIIKKDLDEIVLRRETESTIKIFSISSECEIAEDAILKTEGHLSDLVKPFDDDQLLKRDHNKKYLIYSWSPRMPYSVRGLKELIAAEKNLGFTLIPLLDPNVSKSEIQNINQFEEIPEKYIRQMKSYELKMRGLLNHYPAAIFMSDGKYDSPLIPGYKTVSWYKYYLRDVLGIKR